jgi:hypothetical protein
MTFRWLRQGIVATALAAVALGLGASPSSATTSNTPAPGWYPNAPVHAMTTDGTWVYLGGTFTTLTSSITGATTPAAGLARISLSTGQPDTAWTPSVDGDVRSMAVDPTSSTLYLGGDFTHVDGAARTRLGAVATTGAGAVQSWAPAADKEVRAVNVVDAQTILVAGSFTHIGTSQRQHVALVSNAGVLNKTFKPKINQSVYAASQPPGASFVVIGGLFTMVGGVSHPYIAAIDLTTGAPTSWNPGTPCTGSTASCPVLSLLTTATNYYAAAGGPGGRTVDYNPSTGDRTWTVAGDGDCQALALVGNSLYIGGHFGPKFGGATRTTLAAVDVTTGKLDPNFAPTDQTWWPGVWAMVGTSTGLYVGGDITKIGGTVENYYADFPIT